MTRRLAVAAAVAVFLGAFLAVFGGESSTGAEAARSGPPAGLTAYGRDLWNLEALLRQTFGNREVYFEYIDDHRGPVNFTTTFKGNCCTSYFLFTFAQPRGSAFQPVRLRSPLPPTIGASGAQLAVTVRGRYVYCGAGRWLYYHAGNGPANFQVDCWKP